MSLRGDSDAGTSASVDSIPETSSPESTAFSPASSASVTSSVSSSGASTSISYSSSTSIGSCSTRISTQRVAFSIRTCSSSGRYAYRKIEPVVLSNTRNPPPESSLIRATGSSEASSSIGRAKWASTTLKVAGSSSKILNLPSNRPVSLAVRMLTCTGVAVITIQRLICPS